MSEFKRVGVVGAGLMGAEIALCFARAGYPVALKEMDLALAQKGKGRLASLLDRAISKGRLGVEDKEAALERITPTDQYQLLGKAHLVVEAVPEDLAVKRRVFAELDQACPPRCVLASNTSSIPITQLASFLGPGRRGASWGPISSPPPRS